MTNENKYGILRLINIFLKKPMKKQNTLTKENEKLMEESLREEGLKEDMVNNENNFTFEIWLSTDGKHTVYGKSNNYSSHKKMMIKIIQAYDYIKKRYGTKQELNRKVYKSEEEKKEEINQETCNHEKTEILQVKKEGQNKGKYFKLCETCKKFLGFIS